MTDTDINEKKWMHNDETEELHRLVSCYQIASRDDKNVVWAALNKYLPLIIHTR